MKPIPRSEELLVPKPPENLIFSDDNSESDEDQGQLECDNVDCDPTFVARCSSSEPRLLTQGDTDDFVRDTDHFVMMFALLLRLLDTNTIQLSGVY